MLGVDRILAAREKRKAKRLEQEQLRKQKIHADMAQESSKYQSIFNSSIEFAINLIVKLKLLLALDS